MRELTETMREALRVLAAATEPMHERDVRVKARRRVTMATLDALAGRGLVAEQARRERGRYWFDFYYSITDAGRAALDG